MKAMILAFVAAVAIAAGAGYVLNTSYQMTADAASPRPARSCAATRPAPTSSAPAGTAWAARTAPSTELHHERGGIRQRSGRGDIAGPEGLKCPLPALRTRRALSRATIGDRLYVVCTDPMAAIDIPHLVRETGQVLEAQAKDEQTLTFTIRKTA